jgi:hypothetical protein
VGTPNLLKQGQMQAISHQAELEGYQQVAQLQAAERLLPQMAPYLSDVQDADYQDVTAPPQHLLAAQRSTAPPEQRHRCLSLVASEATPDPDSIPRQNFA